MYEQERETERLITPPRRRNEREPNDGKGRKRCLGEGGCLRKGKGRKRSKEKNNV